MLLATREMARRALLGLVAVAMLASLLYLNVGQAEARTGTLCQDILNRYRVALVTGNYDQANAAREILDLSRC